MYVFHWFLIQICDILQWTVVSTVRYRKSDNWMMEIVYSELYGNSYSEIVRNVLQLCNIILTATTYQKINSSIVSKGAMNGFKKMFPLAIMHRGDDLFIDSMILGQEICHAASKGWIKNQSQLCWIVLLCFYIVNVLLTANFPNVILCFKVLWTSIVTLNDIQSRALTQRKNTPHSWMKAILILIKVFQLKLFKILRIVRIVFGFSSFEENRVFWPVINPLSANPTKWSNTLKQFVGNLPTNCLSVFDHFVILAVKGLSLLFMGSHV